MRNFGIEVPVLHEVILKTKYTKLKGKKSPKPTPKSQSVILACFFAARKSSYKTNVFIRKTIRRKQRQRSQLHRFSNSRI